MTTSPAHDNSGSWQFSPQWRVLPGMAYGVRQPVLVGAWEGHVGHWDLEALDRAMASCIDEAVPDGPIGQDREDDDRALVHRLLFWVCAVQRKFKVPVFGTGALLRATSHGTAKRLPCALPYASPQASQVALQWVTQAVQLALQKNGQPLPDIEPLERALQPHQASGYNTIRFLQAAHDMDVPWHGVVPGVFAYGQGHASRWMESSYSDRTPVLGVRIARDKFRTAQVLRQLGMPAPTHAPATSAQHAVQVARALGYPVVVKPCDRDQGQGVEADLRDDAAVRAAYEGARRYSGNILVEKHVDGNDYRLTVLHGQLIKTIMRRPAGVTGDGHSNIAELVARVRLDPAHVRATRTWEIALLELDEEAHALLAQNGLSAQSIPLKGQFTALRRRANVSAGGTSELVTGNVHPDNRRLVERAAMALQLDIAGVDLILPDISRSWLQTGALVCEVNAKPQLGSRTTPGIYQQMLRALLPDPCRIPVVLVVGSGMETARQLMTLASGAVPPWGLASADGVWQDDEQLVPAQANAFTAARALVANRSIGAAIVVLTPAQLMMGGLPYDRIDVLVVAGPAGGTSWSDIEVDNLWHMALPHVSKAIVCASRCSTIGPTPAQLQHQGVALRITSDDAESLARAVLPFLSA